MALLKSLWFKNKERVCLLRMCLCYVCALIDTAGTSVGGWGEKDKLGVFGLHDGGSLVLLANLSLLLFVFIFLLEME